MMAVKPEMLRDEYQLRFSRVEQYRSQVWQILCRDFFGKLISPRADVLDLGSGWGEFINNVSAGTKYAMDLNPESRDRLSSQVRFFGQDCSEQWPLPTESLDVVFTSNFLEHLPDKAHIDRTVSEAYRCLRGGGLLICLGPNVKYLPGSYWDFWDHFVPLTELSLSEVLRLKGFAIDTMLPRFLPYSMSTGKNPPLVFVRWYLKLPILWRYFGKQFLVVARKKQASKQ